MPLFSWQACLFAGSFLFSRTHALTGSQYTLTTEYSGTNFFDGWDFYTGRDPTGGTVTYYSQSSAELKGLISISEAGPAYMGVNYVDQILLDNVTKQAIGAGRPSVRISSKRAFTHGLFIGDFSHVPTGICGTWPAFWTLGPNWPYNGEIDIFEGVNLLTNNVMSLHTSQTCTITGNASVMTGTPGNTDCAYYPDYNVGCGVTDSQTNSYGPQFNQGGGGAYAMQWTSEYIRVWFWPRASIPANVNDKNPDPSSWGLPAAQLGVGNCDIDEHFQAHNIIFDTTFCGAYAGLPSVWSPSSGESCQATTGEPTCDAYVAQHPEAFHQAYWEVNYVRVYELLSSTGDTTYSSYIASEQPAATPTYTAPTTVATPDLDVDSLCPQYSYQLIADGKYTYEIACGVDAPGPDITMQPYPDFKVTSLADCVKGCSYFNDHYGANFCGAVSFDASVPFCYFKRYIDAPPNPRANFSEIRLIYYGYPAITDSPDQIPPATSTFVPSLVTPNYYLPTTTLVVTSQSTTAHVSTTVIGLPGMGGNLTTSSPPPNYSETAASSVLNTTVLGTSRTITSRSEESSLTTSTTEPGTSKTITSRSEESILTTSKSSGATSDLHTRSTSGSMTSTSLAQPDTSTSPTKTFASSLTSVSPNDNSGTFSATTTISSTNPEVIQDGNAFFVVFDVAVDTSVRRRIAKRDTQYLSFDADEDSILVSAETDASTFFAAIDGSLKTTEGKYVEIDTSLNPHRLALSDAVPSSPAIISVAANGTVSIDGIKGYYILSDGTLSIQTSTSEPTDGQKVVPQLVDAPNLSTSTATTMSSTSLLSTSLPSITKRTVRTTTTVILTYSSTIRVISATSSTVSNATSTTSMSTQPSQKGFRYVGCFGVADPSAMSIPFTDQSMTNAKCNARCAEVPSAFAATHDDTCYCLSSALYQSLSHRQDSECIIPCPGANREICGGDETLEPTTKSQLGGILVSLYTNTDLPQTSISSSTTQTSSSSNSGMTTATVISTAYVDVCAVCVGGLTTRTTSITVAHCGCTADAGDGSHGLPSIPMTTTVATCNCGKAGAQSTITLTLPHSSLVASMQHKVHVALQGSSATSPARVAATASSQPSAPLGGDADGDQIDQAAAIVASITPSPAGMMPVDMSKGYMAAASVLPPATSAPNMTIHAGSNSTNHAPVATYTSGSSTWRSWMSSRLLLRVAVGACALLW